MKVFSESLSYTMKFGVSLLAPALLVVVVQSELLGVYRIYSNIVTALSNSSTALIQICESTQFVSLESFDGLRFRTNYRSKSIPRSRRH